MICIVWNLTASDLYAQHIQIHNVCSGVSWAGFITKPKQYAKYMRKEIELVSNHSQTDNPHMASPKLLYAILMDSDTIFSVSSVDELWNKYDCAMETANQFNNPTNQKKDILMSTETSCWIGRFCSPQNISQFYGTKPNSVPYFNSWDKTTNEYNNIIENTPSYSPFANSGVMMGSMLSLLEMLQYVNEHSSEYYMYAPHKNNKYIFDDQYAYTDYCLKIKPEICGLDYHQHISASIGMTFQDFYRENDENRFPFVCMTNSGDVSYRCPDVLHVLNKENYYQFDENTCRVTRSPSTQENKHRKYDQQLRTLSPTPAIFHGNGGGKRFLFGDSDKHPAFRSFKCYLSKYRGLNTTQYATTEAYDQWYTKRVPY